MAACQCGGQALNTQMGTSHAVILLTSQVKQSRDCKIPEIFGSLSLSCLSDNTPSWKKTTKNFIFNADKSKMLILGHRNSLIRLPFNFSGSTALPKESVRNADITFDPNSLLTNIWRQRPERHIVSSAVMRSKLAPSQSSWLSGEGPKQPQP